MIHLTKRLQAAAGLVPKGARIADIGTDHAYLPVALCASGWCPSAIAADIAEGPLSAARSHVQGAGLASCIECRQSDGLLRIRPGEADGAVFCGMGGPLIEHLLEQSPDVVRSFSFLILQPQSQASRLRQYLYSHGWHITAERLIQEDGRLYEMMKAEPGRGEIQEEWMYDVGPCNWQSKDPLLPLLIHQIIEKDRTICQGLQKSQQDQNSRQETLRAHIQTMEALLCRYNSVK